MAKFWTGKPAITTAIALTVLGSLYIITSPTASSSFTIMHPTRAGSGSGSSSEVPGLDITLAQSARNPPSITVTLKNNNKDTPYTLLKWGTPLDSAALNTGVFSIVAADSADEVEQIVLQINRKMPPGDEEFVTVAPGTQEEVQVTFDKPWMPEKKPAKYKVKAQGEFKGLWDRMGDAVSEDDKNAYIESPFSGKKFSTNEIVVQVE